MDSLYSYEDVPLHAEESISDILNTDCFLIRNLTADKITAIKEPVKFSASTSIFLKRGECKADISLVNYSLRAPMLVNIGQNQILQLHDLSDDVEVDCVVMSKELTDALLVCANTLPTFNIAACRPVVQIEDRYVEAFNQFYAKLEEILSDRGNTLLFSAIEFAMMQFFCQTGWKAYESLLKEFPSSQGRLSDKFMSLVKQNFKRERFLDFYANQLDLTPKHLSRTLKAQTGVTAVEWIERFIVLEAKVLLKSSNLNIQQIADELNFPSQSFFGKYFKKKTGMSPKEFRNKQPKN